MAESADAASGTAKPNGIGNSAAEVGQLSMRFLSRVGWELLERSREERGGKAWDLR